MAESKNFYLQNGAGSETISQRESRVIMVWEGYRSRHHNATISMCTDFLVGTARPLASHADSTQSLARVLPEGLYETKDDALSFPRFNDTPSGTNWRGPNGGKGAMNFIQQLDGDDRAYRCSCRYEGFRPPVCLFCPSQRRVPAQSALLRCCQLGIATSPNH
jgi:hypothetical protein